MKKILLLLSSAFLPLVLLAQTHSDKISDVLWDRMNAEPTAMQDVIILLSDQEDMQSLLAQ